MHDTVLGSQEHAKSAPTSGSLVLHVGEFELEYDDSPNGSTACGCVVCANDGTATAFCFGNSKLQRFLHDDDARTMTTIDDSRDVALLLYLAWGLICEPV